MTGERVVRRLAAILAADVVGYSRLMGRDESGTLARLKAHRTERLEPTLVRHGGRLVKLTGDGALVEFPSAVDALSAAIEFQQAMVEVNQDQPAEAAIVFRMGLHLGDLIVDGDDLYGDGVNVAARLEAEAPPGGIVVSRAVREAVDGRLKAKLHALGELSLKNIERPIRAFRVEWEAADWKAAAAPAPKAVQDEPTAPAPTTPALALPDKPSIAVLPFQNMSGDPEQEYFADGIVEDIITALSRFKSLFVIARNSSFVYKGKVVDLKRVGTELGVRYILEGSVRRAGNQIRVTAQLIDATSNNHLWADRFDGPLEDIFQLQDQVAAKIVGAVAPTVDRAQIEVVRRTPPRNFDAYDRYLRAIAALYRVTGPATDETLRLVDQAIEFDPEFALAHALKAFCHSWRLTNGWMADRPSEVRSTEHHARLAAQLGKDDAAVLAMAGYALASVLYDVEDGSALVSRALEMNPNLAVAWAASAWLNVSLARPEEAIEHAMRYMRLSPLDPNMQAVSNAVASANLLLGRYGEAATWARRALQTNPEFKPALRTGTAAAALAGDLDAAKRLLGRLQEVDPSARYSEVPVYPGAFSARLKEGLRKAGMPE